MNDKKISSLLSFGGKADLYIMLQYLNSWIAKI